MSSKMNVGPNGKRKHGNMRFDEVRFIHVLELIVLTALNDRIESMRYTTLQKLSMVSTTSQL